MMSMKALPIFILMFVAIPTVSIASGKKVSDAKPTVTIDTVSSIQETHIITWTDGQDRSAVNVSTREKVLLSEIERLKEQRDFFKGYYIKEIRKSVATDKDYLCGSFEELRADRISDIVDRYTPCKDDKQFAEIIKMANVSLANRKIYETAKCLMAEDGPDYTPGLPDSVKNTLSTIQAPLSETQAGEIQALNEIAELYPKALQMFKTRINKLREEKLDREGAAASKGYAASIQTVDLPSYIESNEIKNEYRYVIARIPKLKAIYDKWLNLLTKNFMDSKTIAIEDYVLGLYVVYNEVGGKQAQAEDEGKVSEAKNKKK